MRDDTGKNGNGPANWRRKLDSGLSEAVGDFDFDGRFVRHLVAILDTAQFYHLSFAILRAAIDVTNGRADREEFDALIDLGIEVMSREERPYSRVIPRNEDNDN